MPRIQWDTTGSRLFETGLDRGVLYTSDGAAIPWNGLTSVKESPVGGDAVSYFQDGIKRVNYARREDLNGTIEAFTYPDEFAEYDGSFALSSGLIFTQQRRKPFSLSYRTRLGNDLDGQDYGYKLHIIYNLLAAPSEKSYASMTDNISPMNFSWAFTTRPVKPTSSFPVAPTAHVIIDSTKTNLTFLHFIEDHLYGSNTFDAQLMSIDELTRWFEQPHRFLSIQQNRQTGLNNLQIELDHGDLIGDIETGLYTIMSESRLKKRATDDYYDLET